MELDSVVSDQRAENERRDFSWRTVFFGFIRSRRHDYRRSMDDTVVFIDWHHPWLFFLATGTMLLSCADAFLTLQLIDRGMFEVNPFMQLVLSKSTVLFTSIKLALTGFGILVLVYLAKTRFLNRFRSGLFLTFIFSCYACLVCYELVSLFRLM